VAAKSMLKRAQYSEDLEKLSDRLGSVRRLSLLLREGFGLLFPLRKPILIDCADLNRTLLLAKTHTGKFLGLPGWQAGSA
jgi:hypothetical protein